MSSIFQGMQNAGGKLKVGLGPTTSYFRGLPLNAAGEVVMGSGPITLVENGIPFNAAGAVVGLQGENPSFYAPGATACGPNGELLGNNVDAVATVYQGVPYTAAGLYASSGVGGAPIIVAKDFTLTAAQISASSAGFRAAPLAGTLAPDTVYAGGAVTLAQAVSDDAFRVQNTGGTQFPGISGNLAVSIGPYVGPSRLVLNWNAISGWYETHQPGIYTYMVAEIGIPIGMRLSGAPTGSA